MKTISLMICFFMLVGWGRLSDGALGLDGAYSSPEHPEVFTKPKPIDPADVWPLTTPVKAGFQHILLQNAVSTIGQMDGVYSVLVVRDGQLVVEEYFREGFREKPHNLKSASKSVLSAVIGIAIEEGKLHLDQPICELLPQCKGLTDPRKARITVRHLLSMTSGLTPTSYQSYNGWVLNGDWVQAVLDQPMVADPGTHHQYSTGDTHLLSAVLTAATGMSSRDYAIRKLMAPMGISLYGWDQDPQGIYQGGNNLSLIPLDFAKLGQLYLEGGRFRGRQIVPKAWVETSTRVSRIGKHEVYGSYGFLWYLRPGGNDAFVAVGYGGQYLYIAPPQNAVIVVTATLESKGKAWEKELFEKIQQGILGSLQTDPRQLVQAADLSATVGSQAEEPTAAEPLRTGRTRSRLNLRRGPGQTYRVIKTLDAGTVLRITEQRDAWLKVEAGNLSGWVSGDYVRIVPSDAITVAGQVEEKAPEETKTIPAPVTAAGEKASAPEEASTPTSGATVTAEGMQEESDAAQQALMAELASARKRIESVTRALRSTEAEKGDVKAGLAPLARELQTHQELLQKAATDRERLGQQVVALGSDLRRMDETLREQKAENETLLSQLTRTEKELEGQRKETARSEKARETLASEISAMQGRIVSLGDSLGAVLTARAELNNELSALREVLAAERESGTRAQEAQRSLDNELNTAREELQVLRHEWQQAVDEAAKTKTQTSAELTGLRTQLAAMEKTLGERQEVSTRLTDLSVKLKEQGQRAESLAKERDEVKGELRTLREELTLQRTASEKSQAIRQQMEGSLAKFSEELKSQREIARRLESAREGLMADLTSAREEIAEVRTARRETVDKASEVQARLEQEIVSLRTQLAEMDNALRDQQGLSVTLAKVTEELETQRRTAESFQNARESFSAELSGLHAQNIELGTALQSAQADRSKLKAEIRALSEAREVADTAAGAAQKALSEEVGSLRTRLAEMKKQLDDSQGLRAELASARSEIEALRESRQAADEASGGAQKALSQQVGSLQSKLAEMKKSLSDQQELSAELASARNQIGALQESRQAANEASARAQKALSQEVSSLQTQLAEMKKSLSDQQGLTAELASARNQMQALRESRQAADEASAGAQKALSQQVSSLRTQLAEMKKSLGDKQGLTAELASARSEIQALRESRQAADEASAGAQEALSQEVNSLRTQMVEMQKGLAEREALSAKLAALEEELATQQRIAASFETVRDTLLADLAAARKEIRLLEGSRQETVAKAVGVEERLGQELTAFREQLQVLEETFDQQQSDRKAFHGELARVAQELENQRQAAGQAESAGRELLAELAEVRDQNSLLADTLKSVQTRREDLKTELAALHRELATQRETSEAMQQAAASGKTGGTSAGEGTPSLRALLHGENSKSAPGEALASVVAAGTGESRTVRNAKPVDAPPAGTLRGAAPMPAAPALPVPEPLTVAATTTADVPDLSTIDSFVHSWAANWAGQNLEAYLSHYSKAFQPPGRASLKSWYIQRERRLLKPSFIEIIIGNIQKNRIDASRARATFEQEYRSDGYGDRVRKILDLKWENGKWGIVKESSRPL